MVDQNCAYCVEGDLVAKFGIKICELETDNVGRAVMNRLIKAAGHTIINV